MRLDRTFLRSTFALAAAGFLVLASAWADTRIATIRLTDGSVIRGEITALVNSTYAIESEALGRIQIPQARVASIDYGSSPSESAATATTDASDLMGLQRQLASDPAVMSMIQSLAQDPEIQTLLADPAIRSAVQSGDLSALLNDPRFVKLLNDGRIRDITARVTDPP